MIFQWSRLGDTPVTHLKLSRCHTLLVDVSPPIPLPPPHLTITDINSLVIHTLSNSPHLNLTMVNVTSILYRPVSDITTTAEPSADDNNNDDILMIAATVTASVSVTLILVGVFIFIYYKR